jgi:mutator protein MutT
MAHPLEKFRYCPACASEHFAENGPYSKRCESCGFTYYDNPKAATVAIIINNNNEILVCRRAKEPAKDTLDLPGGFTDIGETAENGVIREVKEETGLDVTKVSFLFSKPNIYPYSGMIVNTMDLFFLCKVETTDGLIANDDVAESRFIPIKDLLPEEFGLRSIREAISELKRMTF